MSKQEEEKKLPKEVVENLNEKLVEQVDWFGLNTVKNSEENLTEEKNIQEKEEEEIEKENKSLTTKIKELMHIEEENGILVGESEIIEPLKIKNITIKNGIIYAKEVQDIIEAKITLKKGYLWVVVPHKKENGVSVEISYKIHNGNWWVTLKDNIELEAIEYEKFVCNKKEMKILEIK